LSGIPDLVESIKLQSSGPTEAARAIRKKLKYGNVHRQLRALTLLDGLLQNAGKRLQRAFVDEPLLERLRVCGTSDLSDQQVRDRCKVLFGTWAREYSKTPGLERVAGLYKVSTLSLYKVLFSDSRPGTSSKKTTSHAGEVKGPPRDRKRSFCR
jgi:LAS seventeen-binding protein 5